MEQSGENWISKRVAQAVEANPVPDSVASMVKQQLVGAMTQRAIPGKDLSELAKALIDASLIEPHEEVGG